MRTATAMAPPTTTSSREDAVVAQLAVDAVLERLRQLAAGEASTRLLAVIDRAADRLQEVALDASSSDTDVRATVRDLGRLRDRLHGEQLRRLAEAADRGAYAAARSAADGVAGDLGLTWSEGRTLVETAQVLRRMPRTRDALARGEVTAANAREAVKALLERERLERLAAARRAAEDHARDHARNDADSPHTPAPPGTPARRRCLLRARPQDRVGGHVGRARPDVPGDGASGAGQAHRARTTAGPPGRARAGVRALAIAGGHAAVSHSGEARLAAALSGVMETRSP